MRWTGPAGVALEGAPLAGRQAETAGNEWPTQALTTTLDSVGLALPEELYVNGVELMPEP